MPNKPRPENRHRMVRVEDELWEAAKVAADTEGTTRAKVMREALVTLVRRHELVACHADGQGPCIAACCPIKGKAAPAWCRPRHGDCRWPPTSHDAPSGDL